MNIAYMNMKTTVRLRNKYVTNCDTDKEPRERS